MLAPRRDLVLPRRLAVLDQPASWPGMNLSMRRWCELLLTGALISLLERVDLVGRHPRHCAEGVGDGLCAVRALATPYGAAAAHSIAQCDLPIGPTP